MLIQASRSQLLVVDLQERLLPVIHESGRVLERATVLLKAAGALGVPVLVTEQYPKGIGGTVAAIRDVLPPGAETFEKITFSAASDDAIAGAVARRRGEGRDQLVIAGTEAHVCVLQTALGFRALGYEVFVVEDAVSSRAPSSVRAATARLLHAGCGWVTSEMVAFEWLERAGTDTFRAVLPLIR